MSEVCSLAVRFRMASTLFTSVLWHKHSFIYSDSNRYSIIKHRHNLRLINSIKIMDWIVQREDTDWHHRKEKWEGGLQRRKKCGFLALKRAWKMFYFFLLCVFLPSWASETIFHLLRSGLLWLEYWYLWRWANCSGVRQVHWAFPPLLGELGVLRGFLFILSRQDVITKTANHRPHWLSPPVNVVPIVPIPGNLSVEVVSCLPPHSAASPSWEYQRVVSKKNQGEISPEDQIWKIQRDSYLPD